MDGVFVGEDVGVELGKDVVGDKTGLSVVIVVAGITGVRVMSHTCPYLMVAEVHM